MKVKAVFLDRDGVINKYPGDFKYVTTLQGFKLLPAVRTALLRLSKAGFRMFVVSNQAGVSKGVYSQSMLDRITLKMQKTLGPKIKFDGIFYCTHLSSAGCSCRKPKTGMIRSAQKILKKEKFAIDKKHSYLVGDSLIDIETGINAGLKTILVLSGRKNPTDKASWPVEPDYIAKNLAKAVEIILK